MPVASAAAVIAADVSDVRGQLYQPITATGTPSAAHDHQSPQVSDTRAVISPVVVRPPITMGQPHRAQKGLCWFMRSPR